MNTLRSCLQPCHRPLRLVTGSPLYSRYTPGFQRLLTQSSTHRSENFDHAEPSNPNQAANEPELEIDAYLSMPSWSVESLLPTPKQIKEHLPVSPKQLGHLLRLSALPQPKDAEEEAKMLETLSSQLYFVREIQKVDTRGVMPLRALRDESPEAEKASEITLESLKGALEQEKTVGEHHRRIRRKTDQAAPADNPEGWNPLESAQRKVGKFFVVDSGPTTPI